MVPLKTLALGLALAAAPAAAFDIGEMTDAERAAFRAEVRAYLLDNPEVIMEAVEVLEARRAEQQAASDGALIAEHREAIFADGHSWVGGNPEGDVTLVEFMDYRCGYCRRAFSDVEELVATDGNIRFVLKEFPILGEESVLASRFAIATKQLAGPETYKAVSDTLMEYSGDITLPALERIGSGVGIDTETLDAIIVQMNSDEVTEEIRRTRELARALEITGTPTFVLEDEMIRGFLPYDQMSAIVDEKRG